MQDGVALLRATASTSLALVARQYGAEWATKYLLRVLNIFQRDGTMGSRVMSARVLEVLLPIVELPASAGAATPAVSVEELALVEQTVSRAFETLAADKVSNVRLAVGRAIAVLAMGRSKIAVLAREAAGQALALDTDEDVRNSTLATKDEPY